MDRGSYLLKNLEALTEEDQEDESEGGWTDRKRQNSRTINTQNSLGVVQDDSSVSDDNGDGDSQSSMSNGGKLSPSGQQQEPNKFDGISDGVLNAMAMVQTTMQEMLEFKDEFLKHDLPPIVLSKLALITGKVFRSVSDLHIPVNELIRLVHVYSIPWEEKSTALKKLHEDYESKQRQLNIAIKRLQLVDAHSKRIAREKRIMNWEKLFSRLTTTRGHGRRWKFLIDSIKDKAKLGLEHVQQYVRSLDEGVDGDEDDARDWEEEEKTRQALLEKTKQALAADVTQEPVEEKNEEEVIDEEEDDDEPEEANNETEKQNLMISLPAESDTAATEETETISRASSSKKVHFEDELAEKPETSEACVWTGEPEYDHSLHIRVYTPEGLEQRQLKCLLSFGTQVLQTSELDAPSDLEDEEESGDVQKPGVTKLKQKKRLKKDSKGKRYEEIIIPIESDSGSWSKTSFLQEQQLQIAVHAGPQSEMIAMATIQMDDVKELNLQTLTEELEETEEHCTEEKEDVAKHIEPVTFPLYSLHVSLAASGHKPCGSMPLVLYWGQRLRLRTHDREIATESVRDLVLDLTGIDLDVTTKADLQKEYKDEALSTITFTPDMNDDMVSRADYDKLIMQHNDELRSMQQEYEMHIHELMMNSQAGEQTSEVQDEYPNRAKSAGHTSPSKLVSIALSPIMMPGDQTMQPRPPPADTKPQKNFRIGRPLPSWGDTMPQDFFARLEKYNLESEQHKQEMSEKIWAEINEELERKLLGQRRLNPAPESQKYDAMQDVSLPALFMPFKSGTVFNPRAHQYFHPSGSVSHRLTQPPSMFQLPPLPKSKNMSVLNLFDLSRNFHSDVPEWLMARYIMQQQPRAKSHDPLFPSSSSTARTSNKVLGPWSTKTASESAPSFLNKNSNAYQPVDMDVLFSQQPSDLV